MTITAYFNFIGATEVRLDFAISDLLFPVLQDDHEI